ncbi:MAG: glycosyltransferase [Lewinella sp.]|uniref:glycosyltransferase n=1 Tax=Lewinella sp. TaxID=2004506 RepID=UPI003D6BC0E3
MDSSRSIILVSPKLGIGGIQRALTNLGNWFVKQGYKVTLISCKKEEVFYQTDERIKIITPEFSYRPNRLLLPFYYWKVIKYLRFHISKNATVNVISFGETFNPLVIIACFGLPKKIHVSDRTSPDFGYPRFLKLLKKVTYPKAQTLIAQTTRAKNWNKKLFKGRLNIVVIPNMLRDIKKEKVERKEIILYMGRFAWEKAPEKLIRAYSKIKNKKSFKLVMCGSGPMLEDMKSLTKKLQIESMVKFTGQVNNVDNYYSQASIFVLPSVLEGFPNALCEAMAYGLPSVCFDTIPYEGIGENGKDLIVVKDNKLDLTEVLSKLIEDDELRLDIGNEARNISARLSADAIGKQYLALLANQIEEKVT